MSCLIIGSGVPEALLEVPRGGTWSFTYWPPPQPDGTIFSFSGYTGRGEIRDCDATTTVLLATFTVTLVAPTQTDTDSVRLGITDRWRFVIALAASATDSTVAAIDTAIDAGKSPVFDIEAVSGSTIKKIIRGPVKFLYDRTHL